MAKVEFTVPSVLNKGQGEKKLPVEAADLQEAFNKVSEQMGDDFKRRVFDHNGKPRSLINIYVNGKNMRFSGGMTTALKDGDNVYILPAVAGGAELTSEELQRYSRQVMLEEIGFEGMEKLRAAKVCVVGAGGIGNPVLNQLVGIGVGKIRVVDRDVIEITNLHRQHLYTDEDIGRVKVEAAADRLRRMNPSVEIEPVPTSVTKYTAENTGALGMLGSVTTIIPNKTACLRCLFPALNEEEMPACSTEGVHPSILYLVGGIQVSEAVKILTGQQPSLVNKLMYVDLNELSFEKVQIARQDECPACGTARTINGQQVTAQELIIEELCGRDRGKRTWTITPANPVPVNLAGISKRAETLGYQVRTRGTLGISATNASRMSVSFLSSGAATIVGAKDEKDAVEIYNTFCKTG
jgi:adenylyltransferase/sulfurtransferase